MCIQFNRYTYHFIILAFLVSAIQASAQDGDVLLNSEIYHLIDRIDIRGTADTIIPTDYKPYPRELAARILAKAANTPAGKRQNAWIERSRILADDSYIDHNQKGIWKLYTNRRNLVNYQPPGARLYLDPILYLSLGQDRSTNLTNQNLFQNTRGIAIRGSILNKVGFYSDILETQARYPRWVQTTINRDNVIWGEGSWKPFRNNSYDFSGIRGYITYSPNRIFRFKFGRDRAFFGNGNQSLLLSDHATDYLLFNLTTRLHKFEYVNHFTQMIDYIPNKPDLLGTHPRKYAVFHQLSYRPIPQVSIAIFESIVYTPSLPNNPNRGFELQYLNPLIFYRSLEQYIGSPDNSVLGGHFKINLLRRIRIYGQILIDDYNFGQRRNGSGWWGNKYGLQFGGKWIDVFNIETLDLQAEINQVQPYTYAHYNPSSAYTHYHQYLGHALGSNFREILLIGRYQPLPALFLEFRYTTAQKGLDNGTVNWGSNPLRTDVTHVNDFNNVLLQGNKLTINTLYAKISYQLLKIDCFISAELYLRKENDSRYTTSFVSLRYNIPHKPIRF